MELIKNSYDADATTVTVVAENLQDPGAGIIVVADDGSGMTLGEFRKGFLRVASRLKSGGARRSSVYKRRFTGAKGIGRLAAHKLARNLEVESRAVGAHVEHGSAGRAAGEGLRATIDWDEVELHDTLDQVGDAITLDAVSPSPERPSGTTIRLSGLRRAWSDRERTRFVREVSTFQPSEALGAPIAPEYVARRLIFDTPRMRDSERGAPFDVRLGGEFDVGEDYGVDILSAARWVIEVDAAPTEVSYAVAPTNAYAEATDLETDPITAVMRRDVPGPQFQARIFVRGGKTPSGLADAYGVRVYMEGFRVLPYGEPGDDWIDVSRRYAIRGRAVPFSGEIAEERVAGISDSEAGLVGPPLRNLFGGVFLTEAGAPSLRMLVNREGFVPDETFLQIRDAISNAVALQTRVSAALRPNRRVRPTVVGQPDSGAQADLDGAHGRTDDDSLAVGPAPFDAALSGLDEVAEDPTLDPNTRARIRAAQATLIQVRAETIDEQAMLRVLASLGTQTAAFVHEINAALGSLASLRRMVAAMLEAPPGPREIGALNRRVEALERTIERQSAYLVQIVAPDARRRRSRRRYAEHFDAAALLLGGAADRDRITITNLIPPDLKSPPMYPAEITSVFTNLLSNAIKAAGREGAVEATAERNDGEVLVTVQNTGVAVKTADGEIWFAPYQSTTAAVDPSLGQGMGLGLTITRAMLAEYRGTIHFVEPEPRFATAVQIRLPT